MWKGAGTCTLSFSSSFSSLAHLQVVIVTVGANLITSVHIKHRVQALRRAGILFKLLHLAKKHQKKNRG